MSARNILLNLFVLYIIIITVFLLRPFYFTTFNIGNKNNAQWIKTSNGIDFQKEGLIISKYSTDGLYEKIVRGEGISVEVWLRPHSCLQIGPARIFTYSISPTSRNFNLAQWRDKLIFRLRTTKTNLNGTDPHIELENIFYKNKVIHIVITYDFTKECIYINGNVRECFDSIKGDLTNWDSSHKLVIGNEATADRPWLGEIFYAAIYNRPLNKHDIINLFKSRSPTDKHTIKDKRIAENQPIVCYLFNEKRGDEIKNTVKNSITLPLYIPKYLKKNKLYLNLSKNKVLHYITHKKDIIFNVLGFIPFGLLAYMLIKPRASSTKKITFTIITVGILLSFSYESLQYFIPMRNSSIIDIISNSIGIIIGVIVAINYKKLIKLG